MSKGDWEIDAHQTGEIDRNHKPYIAMRAARCVELSESQAHVKSDMKTSAGSYAKVAGMSINTVKSYIANYDLCVKYYPEALVPRSEMVPMVDYPFPTREQWQESVKRNARESAEELKNERRSRGEDPNKDLPPSLRDKPVEDHGSEPVPAKPNAKVGTDTFRERSNYRQKFASEVGQILDLVKKFDPEEAAQALDDDQIEAAERMGKLLLDWVAHVKQNRKDDNDRPFDTRS